jgi:uncharacterized membrane protein YedE/YeeE
MEDFTPVAGLVGGILIGLGSAMLLALNGRIAGVSGILGGVLQPKSGDWGWRVAFLAGLVSAPLLYQFLAGAPVPVDIEATMPFLLIAGLLVGIGTRMGGGCTSGHGVCGLARLSRRSLLATAIFMITAIVTVYVTRHVVGA